MFRSVRRSPLAALVLVALSTVPAAAAAEGEDRIVVQGDTLRGEVSDLKAEGVVIDLVYGAGEITVPWKDVEDLETAGSRRVLFGREGEAEGRILGLDGQGRVLVGREREGARAIEPATLFAAQGPDDSLMERLRSRFRFWKASLDAGASYTSATSDQLSGFAGLRVSHTGERTNWLFEAVGRYAQDTEEVQEERPPGSGTFVETDKTTVTESVISGFTRFEFDTTDRTFLFASARGVHDAVQELSLRLEPRGGVGVRVVQHERFKLSTDVGGAWVYEDFFADRDNNHYFSVAFGAQAEAKLPYGAIWRARAEYLPAIDAWTEDYLIRGSTEVDFPLLDWLSFVISATDEYDNTPAEDTERNRFTSALALRARFN